MPASTTYRLLAELERYGLVQREPEKTVALGVRMVALGRVAEARVRERLVVPAARVRPALSADASETVILTGAMRGRHARWRGCVACRQDARSSLGARARPRVGAAGGDLGERVVEGPSLVLRRKASRTLPAVGVTPTNLPTAAM